jgi:hypothetical protein
MWIGLLDVTDPTKEPTDPVKSANLWAKRQLIIYAKPHHLVSETIASECLPEALTFARGCCAVGVGHRYCFGRAVLQLQPRSQCRRRLFSDRHCAYRYESREQ